MANPRRYATDLLADCDLVFIRRPFPLWVALGLASPFVLGVALMGTVSGGLTAMLWGGLVRIFPLHHATSAGHGLKRWQSDPGTWAIAGLERCHLAWDVARISPERQRPRLAIRRVGTPTRDPEATGFAG